METRSTDALRRLRPVLIGSATLLVLLLGVFAFALARSQDQQRDDLEQRFHDRATVAAGVNESIFQIATESARGRAAQQFGGRTVDAALLEQVIAQEQQPYGLVLDGSGEVLASAGTPPERPQRAQLIRAAIENERTEYSSIIDGPGGRPVVESASPFPTKFGLRVTISATSASLLARFMNGFLVKLPTVDNTDAYVIDRMGKVIASPGRKIAPGAPLPDRSLASVVSRGARGEYAGDRYFTSAPMPLTPWRIVLAADQDDLYSSVETTVPWLIFAAFVLVSALGLYLLRRVLRANAELERADISRRHALEINDNVVQRLVLAKYALDRGATETSQQKLAETLRETQQLVTSLLEEKEIAPGSLRREVPAETEGPPEPLPRTWQR